MICKDVVVVVAKRPVLCHSIEKFSDTYRQPASSLPAVEEMYPTGTSTVQQEMSRTVLHPQPARICVVEPESVPGLDFGYLDNQLVTPKDYSKPRQDAAGDCNSLRKEFGTQTGM